MRPNLRVSRGEIVRTQPAGEEDGPAAGFDDAAGNRPVVRAPGAAEFLYGKVRVAGIEQDEINLRRDRRGLGDGFFAAHVDDLDELDPGQRATQIAMRAAREGIDDLNRGGPATAVLRDDGLGVGEGR